VHEHRQKVKDGVRVVWLIMCTGIRVVRTRAAWYEMTGLRFVFAVWALQRGVENTALRRPVRHAADITARAISERSFFC
jgi:predicted solute-binding protein